MINGIVAVPVMGIMMYFATRRDVLGQFVVTGVLKWLGWLTTVVMAVAVVTMGWPPSPDVPGVGGARFPGKSNSVNLRGLPACPSQYLAIGRAVSLVSVSHSGMMPDPTARLRRQA